MKIITWNINGYRAITGQNPSKRFDTVSSENKLFSYIEKENPDIICLQETKAESSQIKEELLAPAGYEYFYHSCRRKKGYSGVVTFSKISPVNVNIHIGEERFDEEGRIVELEFEDFNLLNIYFPNGTSGEDRLQYKLEFYDKVIEYCNNLKNAGKNLIICGDYNTAHHEIDIARPDENINNSGFMPIERVKLDKMVELGFIDSFREFNKEPDQYTWWSQRGSARLNNVGWRIDYLWVTPNLLPAIKNVYLQMDAQGSDHCPVILEM